MSTTLTRSTRPAFVAAARKSGVDFGGRSTRDIAAACAADPTLVPTGFALGAGYTRLVADLAVDAPAKVVRPARKAAPKATDWAKVTRKALKAAKAAMAASDVKPNAFPCGSAWVEVRIDRRSRLAKALEAAGFESGVGNGSLRLWMRHEGQAVDLGLAGAHAAAEVLRGAGVEAYASSWLS